MNIHFTGLFIKTTRKFSIFFFLFLTFGKQTSENRLLITRNTQSIKRITI